MTQDLLVDDQEILQKGREIQRCCMKLEEVIRSYVIDLHFTRFFALASGKTSDRLEPVITLLMTLHSALNTVGAAGKACCDTFARDVEDRDKFSF